MCLSISYVLNDTMRARVCARAREKTFVKILTCFFVALRFNRMCISFPFRSIGHTGFTFTHSHGETYYSPSGSEWKRLSFVPSNMLPPLNEKKCSLAFCLVIHFSSRTDDNSSTIVKAGLLQNDIRTFS